MIKLSLAVRNARLNSIEVAVGPSAILRLFTGSPPTSCSDAATGTKLVEMLLPSTWLSDAANGKVSLSGTWSGSAKASGTAGYFRIASDSDDTCHLQGSVSASGGSGDMKIDNPAFVVNQIVTVTSFNLSDANG